MSLGVMPAVHLSILRKRLQHLTVKEQTLDCNRCEVVCKYHTVIVGSDHLVDSSLNGGNIGHILYYGLNICNDTTFTEGYAQNCSDLEFRKLKQEVDLKQHEQVKLKMFASQHGIIFQDHYGIARRQILLHKLMTISLNENLRHK